MLQGGLGRVGHHPPLRTHSKYRTHTKYHTRRRYRGWLHRPRPHQAAGTQRAESLRRWLPAALGPCWSQAPANLPQPTGEVGQDQVITAVGWDTLHARARREHPNCTHAPSTPSWIQWQQSAPPFHGCCGWVPGAGPRESQRGAGGRRGLRPHHHLPLPTLHHRLWAARHHAATNTYMQMC
jgi:hypothetical protein